MPIYGHYQIWAFPDMSLILMTLGQGSPYMGIKHMLISKAKQGLGELGPGFDAWGSPYMGIRGYPNRASSGNAHTVYGHFIYFILY